MRAGDRQCGRRWTPAHGPWTAPPGETLPLEPMAALVSERVKYGKVRQETRHTPASGDTNSREVQQVLELRQLQRPFWIRRVLFEPRSGYGHGYHSGFLARLSLEPRTGNTRETPPGLSLSPAATSLRRVGNTRVTTSPFPHPALTPDGRLSAHREFSRFHPRFSLSSDSARYL
jgi:hypothetical protein